jgi:uncharacterized protein with FMN-binding domain
MTAAMKKLIVSALIIGVFIVYSLVHVRGAPAAVLPPTSTGSGSNPTSPSDTTTSGATSGTTYKNGTYTGSVADAQWGYVQVKAVIQGGKITDVQWLQYPNERDRSVEINQYADPQLTQEAIQTQSAQVDLVSGATDTSVAFIQSLSDALSQAQA